MYVHELRGHELPLYVHGVGYIFCFCLTDEASYLCATATTGLHAIFHLMRLTALKT